VQVVGLDQTKSFKREDINGMLVRHVRKLRQDPYFARSAFVLAVEANFSYVEARDVADMLSATPLQPVITLCEDTTNLGALG
jgi:hypothetical protein